MNTHTDYAFVYCVLEFVSSIVLIFLFFSFFIAHGCEDVHRSILEPKFNQL